MPRLLVLLATATMLFAPASPLQADGAVLLAQRDRTVQRVFSDSERRIIREVLGAGGVETDGGSGGKSAKRGKGAPPGLARRDRLPPGLEQQLQRNGRLPPGLEKRAFPAPLQARLPAPLPGTERLIVGNDAVLIDVATNVVLDIIRDVMVKR